MFKITSNIFLHEEELQFSFVRAPGPGGQNVNKVATAALLRFNVLSSAALPPEVRIRLLLLAGKKITQEGELIIKASRYRTQERNKRDALDRLRKLIQTAAVPPKKRKKTRPSLASKQRRLTKKKLRAKTKAFRGGKAKELE